MYNGPASLVDALLFGDGDAFRLTLEDVLPLQFCHGTEDGQHKLTRGSGGIDGLLLGNELHPFRSQLLHQFQKVFRVSGKAANAFHYNGVSLPDKSHHGLQLRPVGAFSAHTVNEHLLHPQLTHQYLLTGGILAYGADSDVANLHFTPPF